MAARRYWEAGMSWRTDLAVSRKLLNGIKKMSSLSDPRLHILVESSVSEDESQSSK
jgi:hypothetical protein